MSISGLRANLVGDLYYVYLRGDLIILLTLRMLGHMVWLQNRLCSSRDEGLFESSDCPTLEWPPREWGLLCVARFREDMSFCC